MVKIKVNYRDTRYVLNVSKKLIVNELLDEFYEKLKLNKSECYLMICRNGESFAEKEEIIFKNNDMLYLYKFNHFKELIQPNINKQMDQIYKEISGDDKINQNTQQIQHPMHSMAVIREMINSNNMLDRIQTNSNRRNITRSNIRRLMEMGFDERLVLNSLYVTNNDIENATLFILNDSTILFNTDVRPFINIIENERDINNSNNTFFNLANPFEEHIHIRNPNNFNSLIIDGTNLVAQNSFSSSEGSISNLNSSNFSYFFNDEEIDFMPSSGMIISSIESFMNFVRNRNEINYSSEDNSDENDEYN